MYTCCPTCNIYFRITADQLAAASGQVRCGQCQQVFNALISLSEELPGEPPTATPVEPPVAEAVGVEPMTSPSSAGIGELNVPPARKRSAHPLATFSWTVMNLALIAAFVGQLAWFSRDQLGQQAQLRPWMEKFCEHAGCELSDWRDVSQIGRFDPDVRADETNPEALMVSLVLVNQAKQVQPLPDVELTLAGLDGDIIGQRRFTPTEYLAEKDQLTSPMQPGQPIQAAFALHDPGEYAANFRFDLY